MPSDAMSGPQWNFGWKSRKYNEYGEPEKHLFHPENPVPLSTTFFHAEGPEGMGIDSPSGRDYGAVIEGTHAPTYSEKEKKWVLDTDAAGNRKRNWQLRHVHEYGGLQEMADHIANALDFMEVTGADKVNFKNDENVPSMDDHDLVKNLYEKRPGFPRNFKTPERAAHVAELLIRRRDAGIPLTPRSRRK